MNSSRLFRNAVIASSAIAGAIELLFNQYSVSILLFGLASITSNIGISIPKPVRN